MVENCIFIRGKKPTAKIAKQKTNMKSYINKEGKEVVIAEMPDAYLINSYAKQKKRFDDLKKRLEDNPSLAVMISQQMADIENLVLNLKAEVNKRGY